MKKVFTLLILCCVLFLSFKKNEMKSVNLSKDCKIEYVLASDGKKVLGMDIINGNSLIQVSFSEEDDDYSLSIENDGNISCRMIASPERLYSYSIQDKKNDFENALRAVSLKAFFCHIFTIMIVYLTWDKKAYRVKLR